MNLVFRPLADLNVEAQLALLDIRNQESVRSAMYNDHFIGAGGHLMWVYKISTDETRRDFAVYTLENEMIGYVGLRNLNQEAQRADWAFYLDERTRGQGIGSRLERQFLDYVFGEVGLHKLNCEVLESNPAVVAMHKKFGFVEEGFRRDHILRDGRRIGAVLLGITKHEWGKQGVVS